MNYLTGSFLLFIAVAFTKAHWTYLAIGLVLFIILDAILIRWAIRQMRAEPDTDTEDLSSAASAASDVAAVAARSNVGVPRSRSLRPRDLQAEAAAETGSGMPELASAAPMAASLGDLRPGDEVSSRSGKLASYEPLIPFTPAAAADNPQPSPARTIIPEPVGSLMELVTAAPAAPVVPPPAESIAIPSLSGSEHIKPGEPAVSVETIAKVTPAGKAPEVPAPTPADAVRGPESSRTRSIPAAGLIEIPAVPTNPQPAAESKPVKVFLPPQPPLEADLDDVKKTKSPKPPAQQFPASAEPLAPVEAPSAEMAVSSLPRLILPPLIPTQGVEKANEAPVLPPADKPAPEPVPVAVLPESPTPAVPEVSASAASLIELPSPVPPTPIIPEIPVAPAAVVPEPPAPALIAPAVADKPTKAAGKSSGRGRVFLPSIFGKSTDKTPAPVEPAAPEPAAPLEATNPAAEAAKLETPVTPPAAEITSGKEEPKETPPVEDTTKPATHSEDARLESLQAIAREPDLEAPTPEPVQAKIDTPVTPSVEEDTTRLTAQSAGQKTPASEPLPVDEPPVTPAISVPSGETAEKPNPNPGLSPVDAGHIHGAALEGSKEVPAEPAAIVSPVPAEPEAPAPEPVELHDIPLLATEPPPLPKEEPAASVPAGENSAERVDTASILPQTAVPSAETPVKRLFVPAIPVLPEKTAGAEALSTTSQTAAAPAEVASTTTPRSTMPITDTTSSQAPGARASAQLTLGFEVTSLQLTPFFKLGAVQLRPLSNVVGLHLITTDQAENPLAAGISFQIDTVDLDENSHVKSILLKPLGQAQAATVPQPKLQVDNVQVGQGAEGPIQVTSSQGTSTAVQLLTTCTIAAMDFTPSFEIGSLRLEPTSNTVLLRSAPSQRPAALDLPPSFEVANVQLEGSAQIASVRLTPSVAK